MERVFIYFSRICIFHSQTSNSCDNTFSKGKFIRILITQAFKKKILSISLIKKPIFSHINIRRISLSYRSTRKGWSNSTNSVYKRLLKKVNDIWKMSTKSLHTWGGHFRLNQYKKRRFLYVLKLISQEERRENVITECILRCFL